MALAVVAGYLLAAYVLPPFGLRARYFPNDSWSGPPMLQTVDFEMSTDVLARRNLNFLDRYSVEWSGFIVVHRPGVYHFTTNSDDGSELAVDNRTVVFNRGLHGLQVREGLITLSRGIHPVWMQYQQNGGPYGLTVEWGLEGEPMSPLTGRSLIASEISYPGYFLLLIAPAAIGLASALSLRWLLPRLQRIRQAWLGTKIGAVSRRTLSALERPSIAIGLLILVGGAARLMMLLGSTGILWPDSEIFYYTAELILGGNLFQHDPFRTAAYPFFLASFLYWGHSPAIGTAIVATQHAIGLIATVLFYLAGRRVFTPLVALAGALLFSVHAMELFYETSILSEVLFVFVISVVVEEVVRLRWAPSIWAYAWIGALFALATLVRPVGQWLALCIAPVLWFSSPTRRVALVRLVVVLAVNFVLIIPWLLINKREFGFYGVSIGRGMGLFTRAFELDGLPLPKETNYPQAREIAETGAVLHWSANRIRDELNYGLGKSSYVADQELLGLALEAICLEPARFAVNSIKRWFIQLGGTFNGARTCVSPQFGAYLCSGRMMEMSKPPFPNAPTANRRTIREWLVKYVKFGYVRTYLVLAFAGLGLLAYVADRRRRNVNGLYMAMVIGYITLIPAMLEWPQDRYRLPVDALLFMFAAWGVRALLIEAPRAAVAAADAGVSDPQMLSDAPWIYADSE
jgi:PA14 domain